MPDVVAFDQERAPRPTGLRAFEKPVLFALGGKSNPDYYGRMAERAGTIFPDLTLEGFRGAPPLRPSAPDRAGMCGDGAPEALGARERLSARRQNGLVAKSTSENPGAAALDAGWADLAGGRWTAALACFDGAVASKETPEAHEGRSWAGWWLDDADVVFAARDRAYRLYKHCGDTAGAARMATWLACDELDFHGAFAVASGWLGRARRLLGELEPGPEHGWLAFFEGYIASGAGDTNRAIELAGEAAAIGRRLEVPDLEMLGLALEGATLVACAQVDEGMSRLDQATATALEGEATVPIAAAWACCFLVTACAAVRDYERASEWCDRIAEFAERYGSRYMLAFCRAEYGAVHLWRGNWGAAEDVLQASVEDFSRSRPGMTGGPLTALAELSRRQGHSEEAARLLRQAGPSPRAQLCHARLALDRGQALRAVELVERVLRQSPAHRRLDRAPALEVLVCARVARGELDEARAALESLREIERLVGTTSLRASADLAEGLLAAAAGRHESARTVLEDAVDRFERTGGRYDAARARLALATSLLALGRSDAASSEAAAAEASLRDLGAVPETARARRLLDVSGPARSSELASVTVREREVLSLLAMGLTNREIAERLVVSEHTVHRHVTNILRKLGLPSRTAAAAHAAHHGLLEPPAGTGTRPTSAGWSCNGSRPTPRTSPSPTGSSTSSPPRSAPSSPRPTSAWLMSCCASAAPAARSPCSTSPPRASQATSSARSGLTCRRPLPERSHPSCGEARPTFADCSATASHRSR